MVIGSNQVLLIRSGLIIHITGHKIQDVIYRTNKTRIAQISIMFNVHAHRIGDNMRNLVNMISIMSSIMKKI